jgi:cell division transport system ATP-binding protein
MQRVAVARALAMNPDILLADEPTGNLDPMLSEEIMRLFAEINVRGTTVVVATHDYELIRRMGKRVLTLDRGRLLDSETPPATPARELAAPAREAPFLPLG